MIEQLFRAGRVVRRLRGSALGPTFEDLVKYLMDRGYSRLTIQRYVGAWSTSTPNAEADALAIDTANAYYISSHPVGVANAQGKVSSSTALCAVPLVGGTPHILVDGAFAMHLATDGIWLWWAGARLEGVGLGQPSDPATFSLEPGASVEAIAVGRDTLFLAVYAIQSQGPGVGSIRRASKNGSNVTTIVNGLQHPTAIALDEDTVYFNDAGSAAGGIDRAGLDGSDVTTIAQVLTNSLAVDGHAVYFATADAIQKVPKAGGNVETVASGLKSPGTLAVHGGNAYWVDGASVALSDPNPGYAVMTVCKYIATLGRPVVSRRFCGLTHRRGPPSTALSGTVVDSSAVVQGYERRA